MPATLSPDTKTRVVLTKETKKRARKSPYLAAIAGLWPRLQNAAASLWTRLRALGRRLFSWTKPFTQTVKHALRKLPKRVRLGALALAGLCIFYWTFTWITSDPAKLRISCQHNFRSAQLSVWVDSDLVYTGAVNGGLKRHAGRPSSGKAQGFSKVVHVPGGRHEIQVRLSAPNEGYDQTRTTYADFSSKKENALIISSGRKNLVLTVSSPSGASLEAPTPGIQKYASSLVLSIMGSGMSAFISFLVHDFLRTQKERLAGSGD